MMVLILENYFILDTLILMGSLAHKKQKFIANCKNYLYVNTFDLLKITVVIIISEFSVFFSIFLIWVKITVGKLCLPPKFSLLWIQGALQK